MDDPADDFRAAVLQALGAAPDHIEPGDFMRFSTTGVIGHMPIRMVFGRQHPIGRTDDLNRRILRDLQTRVVPHTA